MHTRKGSHRLCPQPAGISLGLNWIENVCRGPNRKGCSSTEPLCVGAFAKSTNAEDSKTSALSSEGRRY